MQNLKSIKQKYELYLITIQLYIFSHDFMYYNNTSSCDFLFLALLKRENQAFLLQGIPFGFFPLFLLCRIQESPGNYSADFCSLSHFNCFYISRTGIFKCIVNFG